MNWSAVDYMFVDMPPETGDVPLTVFQPLPINGVIVVASPQELVEMIVEKAVRMVEMMRVQVLGLVENMAYFECPTCHDKHFIFGQSRIAELAVRFQIRSTAHIPIDPMLAALCDQGSMEAFTGNWLDPMIQVITK